MVALLQPPELSDPPEALSPEQQRRLLATVRRAVERAARAGDAAVRWADEAQDVASTSVAADASLPGIAPRATAPPSSPRGLPRAAARERVASGGVAAASAGTATTAGSDVAAAGGAPSGRRRLPVVDDADSIAVGGDEIVQEDFPSRAVLRTAGAEGAYVHAGGGPYVRSANAARAQAWGRALHGERGYAVLRALDEDDGEQPPFYAVPLEQPLEAGDVGPLGEADAEGRLPVGGAGARLVSSTDVTTAIVGTRDGYELYARRPDAAGAWGYDDVQDALAALAPGEATVGADELRQAFEQLAGTLETVGGPGADGDAALGAFDAADAGGFGAPTAAGGGAGGGDPGPALDALAELDRDLFAAVPWDRRAAFAQLLAEAPDDPRERRTLLELIHATRSSDELEATFALLRRSGAYGRLFARPDRGTWELLALLGERTDAGAAAPTWQQLADVLADAGAAIASALTGTAGEDVAALLPDGERALAGLAQLPELTRTFVRAQDGDEGAQQLLARMAAEAGPRVAPVLEGLACADRLGIAGADERGRAAHVDPALAARVRLAAVAELAAWTADAVDAADADEPAPGGPASPER